MKKLVCCVLFFAFALFAADLTGDWKGIIKRGPQGSDDIVYFNLTQVGPQLTGKVHISGKALAIQQGVLSQDGSITLTLTGGPQPLKAQLMQSKEGHLK